MASVLLHSFPPFIADKANLCDYLCLYLFRQPISMLTELADRAVSSQYARESLLARMFVVAVVVAAVVVDAVVEVEAEAEIFVVVAVAIDGLVAVVASRHFQYRSTPNRLLNRSCVSADSHRGFVFQFCADNKI